MKEIYNLNKIFESYNDFNTSEGIDFEKYKIFLNQYVEINKPDFVALINVNSPEAILHERNYTLDLNNSEEGGLAEIIKAVDKDQIDKILVADRQCMSFVDSNKLSDASILFQMRYNVTLQKENPRTFIRNITFVRNSDMTSEPVLLISIFDVTEMVGIKKHPFLDIKYFHTSSNEDNISDKVSILKEKMNDMLHDDLKLTKRESEILKLISKGITSNQIAQKLFISIATVNTHRQNLIKKFKVKNTSALIHMV